MDVEADMMEMDRAMKLLNEAYWALVNLGNDECIDRSLGLCCVQAADYVSSAQKAMNMVLQDRKEELRKGGRVSA